VNSGPPYNARRAPCLWFGVGASSSVATPLTLSGGDARRGSDTVRMREGEEVQEAARMRTANSRAGEEGPAMRRTDSTRSCAVAALPWSLASPSRHTAAALSPRAPTEPRTDPRPGTVARGATPFVAAHRAGQAGRARERCGARVPAELRGGSCSGALWSAIPPGTAELALFVRQPVARPREVLFDWPVVASRTCSEACSSVAALILSGSGGRRGSGAGAGGPCMWIERPGGDWRSGRSYGASGRISARVERCGPR
jgi:hypothetical protein